MNILWVDDDISFSLESFVDELEEAKFKIIKAKNPDEMWKILDDAQRPIDAIIMDIMMPTGKSVSKEKSKMGLYSGLVLAEDLKKNEKLKQIPMIFFTILSDQEVQDWAIKNDVPLLKKQYTFPEDLVNKIEELLKGI